MKSLQKWENELKMRIHNSRIKQARNVRQSPKTRDVARKVDSTMLKFILKEFDLQQYYLVRNI